MEKVSKKIKVCLVVPFYVDRRRARQKELMHCLKKNLSNSLIDRVIAVCDSEVKLPYHKRLTIINIGRRQRFSDLSNLATAINPGGINMCGNADLFLKEEDIKKILKVDFTNTALALSRWDVKKNGKSIHYNLKDSQDLWLFKGKLNASVDFEMGRRGIDNRLAYEIGLNYNIVNPSNTIKSHHLHLSEIRNYNAKSEAIPPPYLRVPCCYYSDKKIKKVLHIGLPDQVDLTAMLKSFGKYIYFDWKKEMEKHGVSEMREKVIQISNKFKPDLTFMQLQTPDILNPATLSRMSGFLLNWSGDVRSDISWLRTMAPYVDATCLSNETDTEQLREEGFSSWYLQIGFDKKIFTLDGPKLTTKNTIWKHPEIIFMGNNYKDKFPLSKERYEIAKKIHKAYGNKFLLCGQGWDMPAINLMGEPKKEAMAYRSCKIAINANHFIHKRFSSDRIFRIMGSGAFCLTRWYPAIEKDFIDGEHMKTFKDIDEMIYLIDYYLKNEGEREAIAAAGCLLVHEKFGWTNNKKLIEQIASFPQNKLKMQEKFFSTPVSNKEWIEYLNNPNE